MGTPDTSLHRSGAVARMLPMPLATLRVGARRYGLTQPEPTPNGQRQDSADDVRRLVLIKPLTDLGHATGSLPDPWSVRAKASQPMAEMHLARFKSLCRDVTQL